MKKEPMLTHDLAGWALAAALAAVGFLLLMVIGDFRFITGAFFAALVFVGVGVFISGVFAHPLPKAGEVPAPGRKASTKPGSATSAPTPAAKLAAAPAPTAALKASAPLPGEADLAERKGNWTYDGGATPAGAAASDSDVGAKPEGLTAAREGGADNLKELKGVGPKLENLLHELGIFHFDQIAGWGPDEVAWMDENLKGFKGRVTRDDWIKQAKILAAGGETEFSKRVDEGDVY